MGFHEEETTKLENKTRAQLAAICMQISRREQQAK
jgi:hypothetical protein